jgi:hypothetical protein
MNSQTINTAKELKSVIAGRAKFTIDGYPNYMTGLEASNNYASYYSPAIQGEVYIKFPCVVNFID